MDWYPSPTRNRGTNSRESKVLVYTQMRKCYSLHRNIVVEVESRIGMEQQTQAEISSRTSHKNFFNILLKRASIQVALREFCHQTTSI